jgi:hypothetical protein
LRAIEGKGKKSKSNFSSPKSTCQVKFTDNSSPAKSNQAKILTKVNRFIIFTVLLCVYFSSGAQVISKHTQMDSRILLQSAIRSTQAKKSNTTFLHLTATSSLLFVHSTYIYRRIFSWASFQVEKITYVFKFVKKGK